MRVSACAKRCQWRMYLADHTSGPAIERIDAVHLLRLLEPSRSRYLAGEAAGNAVSTQSAHRKTDNASTLVPRELCTDPARTRIRNPWGRDPGCVPQGFTRRGTSMGDRGGKKDKIKNQQQLATKQKNKDQKRLDRAPSKPLAANTLGAINASG